MVLETQGLVTSNLPNIAQLKIISVQILRQSINSYQRYLSKNPKQEQVIKIRINLSILRVRHNNY